MASEAEHPAPHVRELEALRIKRGAEPERRGPLIPIVITLAVLVALAVIGFEVYSHTAGAPPVVQTAPVIIKGGGQPGVLLTGSGYVVTRAKYITIGAMVLGQIMAEPFDVGKHVKKGDLLAEIDDRDYLAQLHQAQAQVQLAKANVILQEQEDRRTRALYQHNAASLDQLNIADNNLAVAKANLKNAQAQVAFAQFNVSQCTIRSPINGVVLKKYREVGSTINYGGDVEAGGGSTDIIQLADTDDMRVEIDVNESDIRKVRMGMPAQIVLDAYPQRTFAARVVRIYPEADRQKGTIKVEVRFTHPDMKVVKPEMSAKVTFLAAKASSPAHPLLLVPKAALIGSGGSSAVWVVDSADIARRVPVVTGPDFQSGIEIKHGLDGGELLIVSPSPQLREGERVTPKASS